MSSSHGNRYVHIASTPGSSADAKNSFRTEMIRNTHLSAMEEPKRKILANYAKLPPTNNGHDERDVSPVRKVHEKQVTNKKGKLVTFYRNGDPHYKGLCTSVSQKCFLAFEALLVWLNEKIPTPSGVRYIFRLGDGREIMDVTEFQPGQHYVVSSVRRLIRNVSYGGGERHWHNKPPSARPFRRGEERLLISNRYEEDGAAHERTIQHSMSQDSLLWSQRSSRPLNHIPQAVAAAASSSSSSSVAGIVQATVSPKLYTGVRPRAILLISNTHRNSTARALINPTTTQDFEEVLKDLTPLLTMEYPPLMSLYTPDSPHYRVWSFTQLFRDYSHITMFIACGRELIPLELQTRNNNLSSGRGSVDSSFYDNPNLEREREKAKVPSDQSVQAVVKEIGGKLHTLWPPTFQESKAMSTIKRNMKIDWVYGYNSASLNGSLQVSRTKEVVYSVGKMIIAYHMNDNRQRIYSEHTAPVSAFTQHPSKLYIASGQCQEGDANSNLVCVKIWDLDNLSTYCTLEGPFMKSILSLDFSKESTGELLLILDDKMGSHNQRLYLFDWFKGVELARTRIAEDNAILARFHPQEDDCIITVGKQHITFWKIFWTITGSLARILKDKKSGLFQDAIPEQVTCLAFDLMGNCISGDSNGSLQVWHRGEDDAFVCRSVNHLRRAHKGAISCLLLNGDGTLLTASESVIRSWDTLNDYSLIKERKMPAAWGRIMDMVLKHSESLDGGLLVGFDRGCIVEGSLQDSFNLIVQGHQSQVCLVAMHPCEHSFVSGGQDHIIIKWSALQHRSVWNTIVEKPCSSIEYHPKGHLLLIGTSAGRFIALHDSTGMHALSCQIQKQQDSNKKSTPELPSILCIRFAPDAAILALGCEDKNVYLFTVEDDGFVYRQLTHLSSLGATTAVLHIDWNAESTVIRCQDADESLIFWDVTKRLPLNAKDCRNDLFVTHSCFFSYQVKGIWKPFANYRVLKRTCYGDSLIAGDTQGSIHLFHYPAIRDIDEPYGGTSIHSGMVNDIGILFDDSFIISCGSESPVALVQSSLTA